jgi:hypothetical protein
MFRFMVKSSTPPAPVSDGTKDDSSYDHTMTVDSEFSTDVFYENPKVGTSAVYFTGNDQQITSPASSTFNLGTAFTIGAWVRYNPSNLTSLSGNGGARIISNYQEVTVGESTEENGYELGLDEDGYLQGWYFTTNDTYTTGPSTTLIADGGWHHIALQRESDGESNIMRIFVDGVSEADTSAQGSDTHATVTVNPFTIGRRAGETLLYTFEEGAIDELEIINGVAKYNPSGFTPSTSPNTSTANHILLMHFDDSNAEPTIWYVAKDTDHWYGNDATYNAGVWTKGAGNLFMTAQNGWNETFRPEKVRVTGTISGTTSVQLKNNAEDTTIASGGSSTDMILQTTFVDQTSYYDFKYFLLQSYLTVTSIEFDADPKPPILG